MPSDRDPPNHTGVSPPAKGWRRLNLKAVSIGVVICLLLGLCSLEIFIRAEGIVDFPIYDRDQNFGYFPRAQQAGNFRNVNHWVFNDRGMNVADSWKPSDRSDILFVGNSIVSGGNAYDQAERLPSRLKARLGQSCPVWPVAAGGWTAVNAVHYLQAHPELIEGSDFFIWELMEAQLGQANTWTSETRFPTHHPIWASGYVLRKIMSERYGWFTDPVTASIPDHEKNFDAFEQMIRKLAQRARQSPRGILVLYPERSQLAIARTGREWMIDRERLQRLAQVNDVLLVDLSRMAEWTEDLYWDQVHPNPFGNVILASTLGEVIRTRAPWLQCNGAR
jgi:hypothetical protein